jgi:peptide/nickel transport system ATP-binding protein
MPKLLEVSDLQVSYQFGQSGGVLALDNVKMENTSEKYSLGIVGESGSGKSTLGMSIMRAIESPGVIKEGKILYRGKNVLDMTERELRDFRWKEVSMIYQHAMNSLNPVKKIYTPIVEVMSEHKIAKGDQAYEEALRLLGSVGFPLERVDSYPHELSGGMRQRVVIALALALSPKLLIADEPTSALDVVLQRHLLSLLKQEAERRNLSLIFITHEIALLPSIVENVAVMYAGEVVETGPLLSVASKPLHPYTEMLLETLVSMDTNEAILSSKIAEQSNFRAPPLNLAAACKYANRCKYAFDRCRKEKPELRQIEQGRWAACHKL